MCSNIVRNHIIELGEIKLKDLKQIDIQKLINSRQDKRRIAEQIKFTINQILESTINNGMIYKNVCRNIKLPSKEKTKKEDSI